MESIWKNIGGVIDAIRGREGAMSLVEDRLHRSKGSVKGLDKRAEGIRSQIIKELDECDGKDDSRGEAALKDPTPREEKGKSGQTGVSPVCPKRRRGVGTPRNFKKRRTEVRKDRRRDE